MQRAHGTAHVTFKRGIAHSNNCTTRLDKLHQLGCARIRFPKPGDDQAEAVLINTAGGLTGGDRLEWSIAAKAQTQCVVTTQACEKIYRTLGGDAFVTTDIVIDDHASVDWLPQETIIFDHASLKRHLNVKMQKHSRFLAVEPIILGRKAMGENVTIAGIHDRWRIFREEKLIHAEDFRLSGNIQNHTNNIAVLNGNSAFATILYVGPEDDEQLKNKVKKFSQQNDFTTAISIFNGKLTGRILAENGYVLRQKLTAVLSCLRTENQLPKVWSI